MTREEAITTAKEECQRRGWAWREPVEVHWGFFSYTVVTNTMCRGCNVRMKIRKKDGVVLGAGLSPR